MIVKNKLMQEQRGLAREVKRVVMGMMIKDRYNPDLFIIELIRMIYGHQIKVEDLIKLIETSPLGDGFCEKNLKDESKNKCKRKL